MYNNNYSRPAIAVGTVKTHGDVISTFVDGVGSEIVGAYELCKKNLTLRGEIQSKVLTAAVKILNSYGKAEIVNGDRLMFVADLAKIGCDQGHAKDFVVKELNDLAKAADLDVEFDTAEAVSWINYVPADDGSYTIASSYGNCWFAINGELASQRKARRESGVTQPAVQKTAPAEQEAPADNGGDAIDKLVDIVLPNGTFASPSKD